MVPSAEGEWQARFDQSVAPVEAKWPSTPMSDFFMFWGFFGPMTAFLVVLCGWIATVIGLPRWIGLTVGGAMMVLVAALLIIAVRRRRRLKRQALT